MHLLRKFRAARTIKVNLNLCIRLPAIASLRGLFFKIDFTLVRGVCYEYHLELF